MNDGEKSNLHMKTTVNEDAQQREARATGCDLKSPFFIMGESAILQVSSYVPHSKRACNP